MLCALRGGRASSGTASPGSFEGHQLLVAIPNQLAPGTALAAPPALFFLQSGSRSSFSLGMVWGTQNPSHFLLGCSGAVRVWLCQAALVDGAVSGEAAGDEGDLCVQRFIQGQARGVWNPLKPIK